ncbi:alpha-ketoglutarate-dependent dioxygenase alkB homolog 7, mitochondrial [Pectinophora gossypiella]|nr:alpha-ketoglutarate-dependent dioxygenase alkB homolog 7, mitochondrial [Pectinophora gossypiella]
MRLLTFSFLKNCKFKSILYGVPRRLRSDTALPKIEDDKIKEETSLVEISPSWGDAPEHAALRAAVLRDLHVTRDFVTEEEEAALMAELEPTLKRMRYEYDHWDNAIHGFRETERSSWQPHNEAVWARVRGVFPRDMPLLAHAHVLDLAPAGHIKPHIDAVRFCGAALAGLCLQSAAIMRFQHEHHKHLQFDALLPRRGLYFMQGVVRYSFTHAVLGGEGSAWRGARLVKKRRVAVICRARPGGGSNTTT